MWKFAGKTTKPRWFELRSTSGRKKQPRRRQAEDSLTWTSPIETNAGIASARSGLMAYPKSYRYTKEHEWIEMKGDRKSTRLNSSHVSISYAVFCLKKKKNIKKKDTIEKHTYNITLIVLCNTYPSKLTK